MNGRNGRYISRTKFYEIKSYIADHPDATRKEVAMHFGIAKETVSRIANSSWKQHRARNEAKINARSSARPAGIHDEMAERTDGDRLYRDVLRNTFNYNDQIAAQARKIKEASFQLAKHASLIAAHAGIGNEAEIVIRLPKNNDGGKPTIIVTTRSALPEYSFSEDCDDGISD